MGKLAIKEWGPAAWNFMHAVTFTMPDRPSELQKKEYLDFFLSIPNVLPCPSCRVHLGALYKKMPPNVNSRKECIQWLIDAHNDVNVRTGKPEKNITQVTADFLGSTGNGSSNNNKDKKYGYFWTWAILLVILVIGIVIKLNVIVLTIIATGGVLLCVYISGFPQLSH
jgi:hypothetical protein